jgi:putative FmdB family regulatory protein
MPFYTYACAANHFKESFRSISNRDKPQKCEVCGQKATKVLTTVGIKLDPCSGDFPSASATWERQHAEKLAWELKHERQHDEYK